MTVEVGVETTRNEHSVIFKLNRQLQPPGTGLTYPDASSAASNPIAKALFAIRGVISVWIIGDEVQVTKDDRIRWSRINSQVVETLKRVLA